MHVASEHGEWRDLGGRADPFSGPPDAAYLPPRHAVRVTGDARGRAVLRAGRRGGAAARVLPGADDRGRDARPRRATSARSTRSSWPTRRPTRCSSARSSRPAGHWSSYPPHKHDRDALPEESFLEETYYHRVAPAHGFALQRVYTADRSLDETLAVGDRDSVLVPRGYHTVSAPPGYDALLPQRHGRPDAAPGPSPTTPTTNG